MPARTTAVKAKSAKPKARKPPAKPRKAAAKKAPPKKSAPARRPKKRFGPRGERLWAAHHRQILGERGLVLLEEACRIADRLDKLDALLKGDADVWCRLVHDVRTEDYELHIDAPLIEARQQANVLRQLVAALPLKEPDRDGDAEEAWLDDL